MQLFNTIKELQMYVRNERKQGKSVGFVPTMGDLHAGHVSLVEQSVSQNDITICSVYVNPTQFNDAKDLVAYTRDEERDINLLTAANCDACFLPSDDVMYPGESIVKVSFGNMAKVMEGAFREGHFEGVGIVVAKLFNIVQPDSAYFGQKDFQQLSLIKMLVKNLAFPITIIGLPTVREKNGLAMSSRNNRLTALQREDAGLIYKALNEAKESLKNRCSIDSVKKQFSKTLKRKDLEPEYFELVDSESLNAVTDIGEHDAITLCVACFMGNVRLIDNMSLFS